MKIWRGVILPALLMPQILFKKLWGETFSTNKKLTLAEPYKQKKQQQQQKVVMEHVVFWEMIQNEADSSK
jgi:hypothetical protein